MIVCHVILVYKKHYSNLKIITGGKMYALTFDTTGSACGIMLAHDGEEIALFERQTEFGQAEMLMPQIKQMLDEHGLKFADLDALFVCVGPGSFTGVRSGISAARTFALASPKLKVGGISAFEGYIHTFAEEEIAKINAVIVETRRDDFYVQFFNQRLLPVSEPEALDRETILSRLRQEGSTVSLAGDGVERFLAQPSGLCLHAVKMFDNLPMKALFQAGLHCLQNRKLNYPKPVYLRAPDVSLPKI
jgi:tRNA threonylcarbamoyladenosine biosynthesis protein TsaB